MLAILSSILMVVTTIIPLIFTGVKFIPKLWQMVKYLFVPGSFVMRNLWWGVFMAIFSFVGGFIFFISIYMGWGLEYYLKFFDIVFTPFSYITENLIRQFINQLPNLPANTSSILCLFDFGSVFAFLIMGFSFEVYLRILIYFLIRRGR